MTNWEEERDRVRGQQRLNIKMPHAGHIMMKYIVSCNTYMLQNVGKLNGYSLDKGLIIEHAKNFKVEHNNKKSSSH